MKGQGGSRAETGCGWLREGSGGQCGRDWGRTNSVKCYQGSRNGADMPLGLNSMRTIGDLDKSSLGGAGRKASLGGVKREQEAVREGERVLEVNGGDGYIAT